MNDTGIDLHKILTETRETLLNPKEYFSSMSLEGGFAEPVIKAVVYGIVAGLFSLLWSLLGLSATVGGGVLGGAEGLMALFLSILGSLVTVFIGGALLFVISAACGGENNF